MMNLRGLSKWKLVIMVAGAALTVCVACAIAALIFSLMLADKTSTAAITSTAGAEAAPATAQTETARPAATPKPTDAPPPTDAPIPTDTPMPADSPEPADAPAEPGSIVEKDGYFLCALAVEDPTTPSTLYQAEAGKRLIAVEVAMGNVSGETITTNPLNATLIDADGFKYTPELGGRDDQLEMVSLNPGEKVRGWIAFEIPEQAAPASIEFSASLLVSLQAGLTGEGGAAPQFPAPPADVPSKLGDVVELGGYSLSATTVEDPAPPELLGEPQPGIKLVTVEIVVGNVSGEQFTANLLDAMLVDADGFVYRAKLGGMDGQLELMDLNPGEKVEGWVAFAIPESATAASIKFELPGAIIIQAGCSE